MVSVLSESATVPASRPPLAADLFTAADGGVGLVNAGLLSVAAAIPQDALWERIEGWVAYRWGSRAVVWVVEGPGEFVPRLTPATIDTTEVWDGSAYVSTTLDPSPLGGVCLPGAGPYRITATVGDASSPPAAVQEAFRRLALYIAETWDSLTPCDSDVRPTWPARAMQYSGAADMLRPYRKA